MSDRENPRWTITKWNGLDNYECRAVLPNGKPCPFATLDRGQMVIHARRKHPLASEGAEPAGPLAGVDFASDEASEFASELGLNALAFASLTPSGKTGAFTKADVRAAAKNQE